MKKWHKGLSTRAINGLHRSILKHLKENYLTNYCSLNDVPIKEFLTREIDLKKLKLSRQKNIGNASIKEIDAWLSIEPFDSLSMKNSGFIECHRKEIMLEKESKAHFELMLKQREIPVITKKEVKIDEIIEVPKNSSSFRKGDFVFYLSPNPPVGKVLKTFKLSSIVKVKFINEKNSRMVDACMIKNLNHALNYWLIRDGAKMSLFKSDEILKPQNTYGPYV
jgi:hypothetical protein